MANFKSIQDILNSNDFLEARQQRQKYVKHEFQDYAYRLAQDLGDLSHRAIYMRLAKQENRTLLEQAAAFAMDYNEVNKGKIFMWKLKQLKELARRRQIMQDHSHSTVMSNMSWLFDELAQALSQKQQSTFLEARPKLDLISSQLESLKATRSGAKVLVSLVGAGWEANYLAEQGLKVFGLEISRLLAHQSKNWLEQIKKAKVVRKSDFLQNTYKDEQFDALYITRLWELIPFSDEKTYLTEFKRLLKPGGLLYLEAAIAAQPSQYWQEFTAGETEYIRFKKINMEEELENKLQVFGFELHTKLAPGSYLYTIPH